MNSCLSIKHGWHIKTASAKAGLSVKDYIDISELGFKKCTGCKEFLSIKFFTKDSSRWDGYNAVCKNCRTITKTRPTPISFMLHKRIGYNWCSVCNSWKHQVEMGPKNKCKICIREYSKLWYHNGGKEYVIAKNTRRKRNAGIIPHDIRQILFNFFDNKCAYCGKNIATTIDHITPVMAGGKSEPNNMVPACVSCNSSKKAKALCEWYHSELSEKFMVIIKAETWDNIRSLENV